MIVEVADGIIRDMTTEVIVFSIKLPKKEDQLCLPPSLELTNSDFIISNKDYLDLNKKTLFMSLHKAFALYSLSLCSSVKSKEPNTLELLLQNSWLELTIGEKTQLRDEAYSKINNFEFQGSYFQSSQGLSRLTHKNRDLLYLNAGQAFSVSWKRPSEVKVPNCEYNFQLNISGRLLSPVA